MILHDMLKKIKCYCLTFKQVWLLNLFIFLVDYTVAQHLASCNRISLLVVKILY